MIQICRLWNLSLFSVIVLTLSNILLTVKLLHNGDCPTITSTITNNHNINNNNNNNNNNNDNINQNKIIHSTEINNVNNNNLQETINNNNNNNIDNIILNDNDDSVNAYAIPKPPLTPSTCVEYIIPDEQSNITDHAIFSSLNVKLGRWDSRRLYQYYDYAVIGDEFIDLSKRYTVCLATQTSLERLHSLVQVAHHWRGPISIAVFVTGNDELYLLQIYITYLRKCYAVIRDEVSIHLAYPKLHSSFKVTESTFENLNLSNFNCNTPELTLSYLLKLRSMESVQWHTKFEYPQNHLRNLARKGCQNDNVFLTDVDIIPSLHFAEHLDRFLRKTKCQNLCAYVIPTYEIDNRVQFPKDKLDLIRLARKGLARPFHHKVFIYNQFATNFSRWETDLRENGETHISYNVTNFEFLYEPFYVANDLVPLHDERFLGYGFTRNTQVYEMFVAGYQFQVLSPIFTCHWGLQNKKNRPVWRERQNNQNRKQLEIFKREVFARYRKDPLKMLQPKIKNGKYVHST